MKRYIINIFLLIIIGMTWASSCTSDPEAPLLESEEELMFEVKEETSSRAIVSTTSNLDKKPFTLFGDMYRTGEHFHGLKLIFDGDKVTYANNKWSYGSPLYWLMGQEHSFVALHPALDFIQGISDLSYSASEVSFTYTIPKNNNEDITEYSKVTDLLVATHRRLYTLDSTGAVKFGFRHILSRINIEPALDEVLMYEDETDKITRPDNKDEYIQFNKFEIYGLRTKASFAFTPAPLPSGQFMTDEKNITYEVDDSSLADAVLTFPNPTHITNNKTNVNICDNDNAFLVLPQSVGKDAKLVLYYTVNSDHQDKNYVRTVTFPLSGLPIDKWEAGKSYTYKFTIEKAYTGQIKEGSIKWEINDRTIPNKDDKENWISGDSIISQTFNPPQ